MGVGVFVSFELGIEKGTGQHSYWYSLTSLWAYSSNALFLQCHYCYPNLNN